jgi:hypothetical protein
MDGKKAMESQDWSREEAEAIVATYLDMLELELQGVSYNKSEHRRRLTRLLAGRSDSSIERKNMNISAVLIEMEHPSIDGYKPYFNYQKSLLPEVVGLQLDARPALQALVTRVAQTAPAAPIIADILAAKIDPPGPQPRSDRVYERPPLNRRRRTDFVLMEARNSALGLAGEEFVVEYERTRLISERRERLAAAIEHTSVSSGDGAGFDVLSFDADGKERLIEVKTTKSSRHTPFFVSSNELRVSKDRATMYHVYRVFSFEVAPRLFMKTGPIDQSFRLTPDQYIARAG